MIESKDKRYTTFNILKNLCRNIYLIGVGDFWYEQTKMPKWRQVLYCIYCFITASMNFLFILNESLEVVFSTYPEAMHRDAISYSLAHINIYYKMHLFKRAKPQIKGMLKELIKVCDGYEDLEILKIQHKKTRLALILQFLVIYFALVMYILEALRRMFVEGNNLNVI